MKAINSKYGSQLYASQGNQLKQLRPGFGVSKLRDIDRSKLPELNLAYGAEYFKRIRKDLFGADFKKNRGVGKAEPIKSTRSVSRV